MTVCSNRPRTFSSGFVTAGSKGDASLPGKTYICKSIFEN